jgi:hypothetical protein
MNIDLVRSVSLEPEGARLDVTHRFSVTQPMPGGATTITLCVPQYYKQTPSGWVRAMPGPDFWGAWRKLNGKHVVVIFPQRDASVVEPLVPRLDEVMQRLCGPLDCPAMLLVTPLAFDFLERQFGAGTVPWLLPALASARVITLGEAISMTLRVNSATLEPAWQKYLQQRIEAGFANRTKYAIFDLVWLAALDAS